MASAKLLPSATLSLTSRTMAAKLPVEPCFWRISKLLKSGTPERSRSDSCEKKAAIMRTGTLRLVRAATVWPLAITIRTGNSDLASSIANTSRSLPAVRTPVLFWPVLVTAS